MTEAARLADELTEQTDVAGRLGDALEELGDGLDRK